MKELLLAIVVVLAPVTAKAQAEPDSVKHRNDCRFAVQVVTTGRPAVKADWAIRKMRTCPASAADLAQTFRIARGMRDTTYLARLTAATDWLRDGGIFSAAVDVLRDRAASVEARVFATRVVMWAFVPGEEIHYGHLVDTDGDGDWTCGGMGPSLHGELTRGAPLPTDWAEQARALGRALALDTAQPTPVRQAATCLAVILPFRHVAETP